MIQKLQSTLGKNTPTIHKRIEAQLKGILNPNGNKFKDWPRIETKTLSTDAKTILFLATTGDGRATLIQGKFHCFAIFCESKDELYGFDNTVGCLKFEKEYLLKRFIWWAAECNDELLTNPKRYPPWTAVACWKKRNSGTSWCRGKLV